VSEYPRRGEVYFAALPDETKQRPVIVVSPDPRNHFAHDVLVVPVTTAARPAPTHVSLEANEGGLPRPSTAQCEHVTTLHKQFLQRGPLAGRLPLARMQEIERGLMRAVGVVVPDTRWMPQDL